VFSGCRDVSPMPDRTDDVVVADSEESWTDGASFDLLVRHQHEFASPRVAAEGSERALDHASRGKRPRFTIWDFSREAVLVVSDVFSLYGTPHIHAFVQQADVDSCRGVHRQRDGTTIRKMSVW
jgi:hypothetical protein